MSCRFVPLSDVPLADVAALQSRADAHDGVPLVLEEDELREELEAEGVDLAVDGRAALDGDVLVGYAYALALPPSDDLARVYLFGAVAPDHRRHGIGRELLTWVVGRAGERLAGAPAGVRRVVRAQAYEQVEDAHRLLAAAGFTPVRRFEELLRPLTDLPERREPEGIRLLPWPDDRDGELLVVKNAAWLDHWGSTPTPPDTWAQQVRGFAARPDLSSIAVDGETGRPVGLCLAHRYEADDEGLGRREGWISLLGTLAEWRGRGIASALITEALHAFAGAGLTHAAIGVDADSLTGAAALYRRLGFVPLRVSLTHELER